MNVYVELLRKLCKDVHEKLDKGHWGGKCRVSPGLPRLSVGGDTEDLSAL